MSFAITLGFKDPSTIIFTDSETFNQIFPVIIATAASMLPTPIAKALNAP
jgi:hypothetical protein